MRQTLSLDTCFAFGKYKNHPISEVLNNDPGYILYLIECGYEGKIDAVITSAIDAWKGEKENEREVLRVKSSARASILRRTFKAESVADKGLVGWHDGKLVAPTVTKDGELVGLTNPHSEFLDAMQYTASAPVAPVKKEDPALWGTW